MPLSSSFTWFSSSVKCRGWIEFFQTLKFWYLGSTDAENLIELLRITLFTHSRASIQTHVPSTLLLHLSPHSTSCAWVMEWLEWRLVTFCTFWIISSLIQPQVTKCSLLLPFTFWAFLGSLNWLVSFWTFQWIFSPHQCHVIRIVEAPNNVFQNPSANWLFYFSQRHYSTGTKRHICFISS